ncbi:hypothetical protein E2562_028387 [Oryza meyeriana var. granulata]|uniref:Uncharacterized protein n=1 Tax=Oryza meyeriana var. granulata TaxID=110450 RepID=A0A6G1E348_9ORYZ|nr:hypothetical protein E2562_028387 [Oryza meyeriana var. granulata]
MATRGAAIEVTASPSPLSPTLPPSKPPLRLNQAVLLLHTTKPTTYAATGAPSPLPPSVDWLISFLSFLILRRKRPKKPSPHTAAAALRRRRRRRSGSW